MSVDDLKDSIKENKKLTIGKETTIKQLKLGKLEKIYMARNCESNLVKDVEYYSRIAGISAEKTELSSEELGILCKKPFNISIVGVKKADN